MSPLDALLVINFLNIGELNRTRAPRFTFDVNRDGYVSPLDVLWIINFLNSDRDLAASGESAPEPRSVDTFFEADDSPKSEEVFDDLEEIVDLLGRYSFHS